MRSKSPLALMEQLVMVLVFALAAALCLQVFAFSDRMSKHNAAIDRAVLECQNAAEILKATGLPMDEAQETLEVQMGGRCEEDLWYVWYDENWQPVWDHAQAAYVIFAQEVPTRVEGLVKAQVWADRWVTEGYSEALFSIDVAWQEVGA